MPSLRSSTIAALRQRIVSGENGNVKGIPFAFRSGLPSRRTPVVPWRGLDREAGGFEPADELADVLPHLGPLFREIGTASLLRRVCTFCTFGGA